MANSRTLNPISLWRLGFDWQGRTTRLPFFLICLIFFGFTAVWLSYQENSTPTRGVKTAAILVLALLWLPVTGHILRRLNDMGRSGWWWWLLFLPILNLAFLGYLTLARSSGQPKHGGWSRRLGFAGAWVVTGLLLTRIFWEPFWIPAGSMKPTLQIGDYLVATHSNTPPARGDVVIFHHPITGHNWIKRVIALPGESVQMKDGIVHIGGVTLPQSQARPYPENKTPQGPEQHLPRCANDPTPMGSACLKTRLTETTPEGPSYEILNIREQAMDNTPVFTVPDGHYFVLGDNRDNSSDSRIHQAAGGVGMVPAANITARARFILFSSAGKFLWQVWTWRPDRFMKSIP